MKALESESRLTRHSNWRISIVMPAHNEAKNLPYVLPLIPGGVDEVILINDHSTDDTAEVARKVLPTIRIVNNQYGYGKGAALKTGFAAANGDIIIMMRADGSSDPREIPRFFQALLAGAYFARGSRFVSNGGSADVTPLHRLGSRVLVSITNKLFRVHNTDLFCGLNVFWRDCFDFFEIDCEDFDVEMLIHLRTCKANLEVVEVPSYEHLRIDGGRNSLTFKDGWRALKLIIREWMNGRTVIRTAKIRHRNLQENMTWDGVAIMG